MERLISVLVLSGCLWAALLNNVEAPVSGPKPQHLAK